MLLNIIIFPRTAPPCCATAGICKCLGLATFVARRDGGWPECCNWCNRFLLASLASASSPRAHCFSSAVEYLRTITTPCVCCPRVYSFQRKIKRFGVFSSSCLTLISCRYNPNLLTRRRIIANGMRGPRLWTAPQHLVAYYHLKVIEAFIVYLSRSGDCQPHLSRRNLSYRYHLSLAGTNSY